MTDRTDGPFGEELQSQVATAFPGLPMGLGAVANGDGREIMRQALERAEAMEARFMSREDEARIDALSIQRAVIADRAGRLETTIQALQKKRDELVALIQRVDADIFAHRGALAFANDLLTNPGSQTTDTAE